MSNKLIATAFVSAWALLLCQSYSVGQSLSGTSLNVTGTSTLNVLQVTGIADFQNNTLFFGTSGSTAALSLAYDGTGLSLKATNPAAAWNWQRLTGQGAAVTSMQLDASNRLIITGTGANPPQIILDPNGAASINGSSLLTQTAADALYLAANGGISMSNGNVGIGTVTPGAKLDVAGNLSVGGTIGTLTAQVQINPTSPGRIGETIIGAPSQTASLQEWQNSAGATLASIKIGNGGTPPFDYGKLTLASAENVNQSASFYVSEDTIAPTGQALYITPPGNGRIFFGDVNHSGYSVDFQKTQNMLAPAYICLASRSFSSGVNLGTSLHPDWKVSILQGAPDAGLILHPGSWTNNILGDMSVNGMASLPFLVDTRDGQGYQRGAGYIFGHIQNYNTYSSPHTLWWADMAAGAHLMALQMTGELDLNIQKPSAKGIVIKGASSQSGDLMQWQNTSGAVLSVVNKDGWVGIGASSPQAALDVSGNAKLSGNLALSGTGSLTLPDGTVLSGSNTLKSVISSGTASMISGTLPATHISGLSAVATTGSYGSLAGLPTIPTDTEQLANGAGYITASGTSAFAQISATAASLSGTISAGQVAGLSAVATGGNLDYTKLNNVPATVLAESGTARNLTLSGTTNFNGDTNFHGKFTVSGSNGSAVAMQLDASNRLILTGTAANNPPQIMLDPNANGLISMNGSNLLTQSAADALYLPANAGLVAVNGNIGIGTTTPQEMLDVNGNAQISGNIIISGTGSLQLPDGTMLSGSNSLGYKAYAVGAALCGIFIPGDETSVLYGDWYWQNDPSNILNDIYHGGDGVIVAPFDGVYHFALQGWSDYSPAADTRVGVSVSINDQTAAEYATRFQQEYAQVFWTASPYTFFLALKAGDRIAINMRNISGNGQGWIQKSRLTLYYASPLPASFAGNTPSGAFPGWVGDGQTYFMNNFNPRFSLWDNVNSNAVLMDGAVGINTINPAAQLHVAGSGRFDGPVRIAPQGDLDMGAFTADSSQAYQQNLESINSRQALQTARAASAIISGTVNPILSGSNRAFQGGTAGTLNQ